MPIAPHLDRLLVPGRIVRLTCSHIVPPKDKYCVLVARERYLMYLFINSQPTDFQSSRADLMAGLVSMRPEDCPRAIRHVSYIDCNEPEFEPDLEDVQIQVDADPSRVLSMLPPGLVLSVRAALSQSLMITPGDLRVIVTELSASEHTE